MSKSDPISASADAIDPDDGADEADRMADAVGRAERRLARVQEITEIGMALLRDLGERVAAAKATPAGEKSDDEAPSRRPTSPATSPRSAAPFASPSISRPASTRPSAPSRKARSSR